MCEKLNELYKKKFRVNLISNDSQKKNNCKYIQTIFENIL